MEIASPSSPSVYDRHGGSTYDELSMQQSIMFSDCLKVSLFYSFIFFALFSIPESPLHWALTTN